MRELMRLLHTIKGSARMAGAMRLGELVHDMEARIETAMALPHLPDGLSDDLLARYDVAMTCSRACSKADRSSCRHCLGRLQHRPRRRLPRPARAGDRADDGDSEAAERQPVRRKLRRRNLSCASAPTCSTGWSTRPARC